MRRILIVTISILLITPALIPLVYVVMAKDTRVCGVDNNNYPSPKNALEKGIEVSYEFPCQYPEHEMGLYERYEEIELTGMLLESSVSPSFFQVLIRENSGRGNFFAIADFNIKRAEEFLPGDQLKLKGMINKNTGIVDLENVENISLQKKDLIVIDCIFLDNIDKDTFICKDDNSDIFIKLNNETKFAPLKRDELALRKGDHLKIRKNNNRTDMVILKERDNYSILKPKHFVTKAKITEVNKKDFYINAIIEADANTAQDYIDLNNAERSIIITAETRMVKKYFGKIKIDDLSIGDELFLLLKEEGESLEAKMIKNLSKWK